MPYNPLTDIGDDDATDNDEQITLKNADTIVHLRVQQRNGKKMITTVEGLADYIEKDKMEKLKRYFMKQAHCSATIIHDEEFGPIIQLQGDHRMLVREILLKENITKRIEVHGA